MAGAAARNGEESYKVAAGRHQQSVRLRDPHQTDCPGVLLLASPGKKNVTKGKREKGDAIYVGKNVFFSPYNCAQDLCGSAEQRERERDGMLRKKKEVDVPDKLASLESQKKLLIRSQKHNLFSGLLQSNSDNLS